MLMPPAFFSAMPRRVVTMSPALFQPSLPRSSGTMIWAAWLSAVGIGPVTLPSRLAVCPNAVASSLSFCRSAGVSPDVRS